MSAIKRYHLNDPRYDATYVYKDPAAMIAKADAIGCTCFQAVTEDNRYIQVRKIGPIWVRDDDLALGGAPTETPEFKAWFGDSRAVNSDGFPRVFYHGTDNEFSEFDLGRIGEAQEGKLFAGHGFYFSDKAGDARCFGSRVMIAYLRMERPLDLRDPQAFLAAFRDQIPLHQEKPLGEILVDYEVAKARLVIQEVLVREERPGFFDVQWKIDGEWVSNWPGLASSLELSDDPTGWKYATQRALPPDPAEFMRVSAFSYGTITRALKQGGYDGAINHGSIGLVGDEYLVLSPDQIKVVAPCGAGPAKTAKPARSGLGIPL